jgi:cytoskeletal protein CcmA (bactofilin family)
MWYKRGLTNSTFGARRNGKTTAQLSILSAGATIDGDVITDGDLYIGGSVKGRVVSRKLTLCKGASIYGVIEAETANISGIVTGKLSANQVTLTRTARVTADVTHVAMNVEAGAIFEGYSRRVESVTPVANDAERIEASPLVAITHNEVSAA